MTNIIADLQTNLVQSHFDNGILTLTLNRADKKNALTGDMYDGLAIGLRHAAANPAVRVVILTGGETCFTAGNDIQSFIQITQSTGMNLADSPVTRFMFALFECPKIVIAAVNGVAVGIGVTLLMHCDFVFLGDNAMLQMPFVNIGLCPEFGASQFFTSQLGARRANEYLLLGKKIPTEVALNIGLANAVLPASDTLTAAQKQAAQIVALAPQAVRTTKALMKRTHRDELIATMNAEIAGFTEQLSNGEAQAALMAFAQKRAPDFSRFQ